MAGHTFDASGKEGGSLYFDAGDNGRIFTSATFKAEGAEGKGGSIEMTGGRIGLLNARVSVDGTEGGILHIGGGWQGSGELRHARETFVSTPTLLSAKGRAGKGGEIVVWSSEWTDFYGTASAEGTVPIYGQEVVEWGLSPDFGLGGRIEISSKDRLTYNGTVNAGPGGSVLFDPKNLTIAEGTSDSLTWVKKLASSTGATNMPSLVNSDWFGRFVALDGDRLAVGADGDDTGGTYRGAVHLFTGMTTLGGGSDTVDSATYANNPSGDSTITPTSITDILNVGTAVTLQANNDITVSSAITANNTSGNGGVLTLQAGRSILLNANITTDNGNLLAKAGDSGADPTYTDAGTATITIANGVTLNIGTGAAELVARNGNFINNAATPFSTSGGGYWRVYSTNPANDTRGSLSYNFKQYNASYGDAVLGSGNGFLYSLAPAITAALTGTVSKEYDGNTNATLSSSNYTTSGAIDGDTVTLNNPTSGSYDNKDAGTNKTVTVNGLSIASAVKGSATVYGYSLSSTTALANIGEITGSDNSTDNTISDSATDNTTAFKEWLTENVARNKAESKISKLLGRTPNFEDLFISEVSYGDEIFTDKPETCILECK